MNEVLTQGGIGRSALMLCILTFFLFFSFSSASKWDSGSIGKFDYVEPTSSGNETTITGDCPDGYAVQNITDGGIECIEMTGVSVNSTQFDSDNPIHIKTSWLTSFIESISKWGNYYDTTQIDNRYSNNTGDQDLSTYVQGNMSAETYNETTITPTTNYSLSFDGDAGVTTPVITLGNTFSYSAWVNPSSIGVASTIAGYRYDSSNYNWRILSVKSTGHVGWYVRTSQDISTISSTTILDSNNWYFITGTYDGTTSKLYINGVKEVEDTITLTNYQDTIMGIGYMTSSASSWFNGSIDEVLIFNRSLNSTEVSQLYNSGNGLYANTSIAPFNDGLVAGYHFDEGTGTIAYDLTGRNNGTLTNGPSWVDGKISHNLTSTTETLGAIGLMPWVSSTNFISTDYSLQWIGNTLKNPWFTSTELGNSTNRWNIFAWDTETVNLNVTNQTTMNNLTVNNLNVTNSFTGNCVNASILNGIIVGCND